MKVLTISLPALALLVKSISGHYTFGHLIVNKTETPEWSYMRDVGGGHLGTREDPEYSDILPTKNVRCGVDAWRPNRNKTLIADVIAGSEIGIRKTKEDPINAASDYIFHIGPAQVYLAKAPNDIVDLAAWDGDGDWFKIATIGAYNDTLWELEGFRLRGWNFTIPKSTPPGKYLLRHEQIWPRAFNKEPMSTAQFYINCAQLNIIGEGGGTPSPTVKFPGAYTVEDPGISIPNGTEWYDSESTQVAWTTGFMNYTAPGPAIWTG